eukprot:CAMPEP_0202860976 /NCGR_PEP_ID=MMETSP1391-20130828/2525_1 /ASSEMBLY_ACC=CAM_ASM_000867 /TAXON_ID=1034604 /ORGANISM="Chlamydomonas leiostraca, Strain SAG 11-49" /LENGTH=55 /DNA_ID=CAMNT_0049540275 /DNA_START=1446 /DNA_END=1613 /DNA_ORIENTATION=+
MAFLSWEVGHKTSPCCRPQHACSSAIHPLNLLRPHQANATKDEATDPMRVLSGIG